MAPKQWPVSKWVEMTKPDSAKLGYCVNVKSAA